MWTLGCLQPFYWEFRSSGMWHCVTVRVFPKILRECSAFEKMASIKVDSHIASRPHAIPLPCRAAKGLECAFPIWFTQCGRVWFTLAMPRPCHALTMPFFSRPWHSTAVQRRPVGHLPAFGFFWLPPAVPQRLLSEAYQSSSQWYDCKEW